MVGAQQTCAECIGSEAATHNCSRVEDVFNKYGKEKSANLRIGRPKFSLLFCPTGEGPCVSSPPLWVLGFYSVNADDKTIWGSPGWLSLDLSSGLELTVCELKPHVGLHAGHEDYLNKQTDRQTPFLLLSQHGWKLANLYLQ